MSVHDCYAHLLTHDKSAKRYREDFNVQINNYFYVRLTEKEVQERLKEVIRTSRENKNKIREQRMRQKELLAESKRRAASPLQSSSTLVSEPTTKESAYIPKVSSRRKPERLKRPVLQQCDNQHSGKEQPKDTEPNVCADRALELVKDGRTVFITGKAGTGKTTLLKRITSEIRDKKIVVTAPTGVAAKNAGGVTIHSLLRLPISLYLPDMHIQGLFSLTKEEAEVIRLIDVMIIDEVSMVRCDLLDMVDTVLRHYRKSKEPFGGVQVVMFGDLYQLMPVVKTEDWEKLRKTYKTPYFFSSKVLGKTGCPMYELKKVFRQSDGDFRDLLNRVRNGCVLPKDMRKLQERCMPNFTPAESDGYIRLTTHNILAKKYNQRQMDSLETSAMTYKAYIDGYIPRDEFPNDYHLQLKKGARVMFIRNDNATGKYVNGTLGTVTCLYERSAMVRIDNGPEINVDAAAWEYYQYKINKLTKEIERELVGVFHQLPLKLAWAVTIHKSQGLTFDKVVIDAGKAFTYGQVYVALSRCRKFHGMVLASQITEKIIKTDPEVVRFMQTAERLGDVDGDLSEEVEPQQDKLPNHLKGTVEDVYWMIRDGLSYEEIVQQSAEPEAIIQSCLAKLALEGLVDVGKYIDASHLVSIREAIQNVGVSATLKEIKSACKVSDVKFNEISMVVNQYIYESNKSHELPIADAE